MKCYRSKDVGILVCLDVFWDNERMLDCMRYHEIKSCGQFVTILYESPPHSGTENNRCVNLNALLRLPLGAEIPIT